MTEDEPEVARTSFVPRKTELQQQLQELKKCERSKCKADAHKTLEQDDLDEEEAGSEEALRETEQKLRRPSSANADELGRLAIAAKTEAYDIIQGHLDNRSNLNNITEETRNAGETTT